MASRLKEVKNVLILGSSGFTGSNIARKLSEFDLVKLTKDIFGELEKKAETKTKKG